LGRAAAPNPAGRQALDEVQILDHERLEQLAEAGA
jgi:hypothetical protein